MTTSGDDQPRWTVRHEGDSPAYGPVNDEWLTLEEVSSDDWPDLVVLLAAQDALVALVRDHAAVTQERDALRTENRLYREYVRAHDAMSKVKTTFGYADAVTRIDAARAALGDTP